MTNETGFRAFALILMVLAFGISGYFRRKADRESGELKTSEGKGLLVLLRLIGLAFLLPVFAYFLNPDLVTWARLDMPGAMRWAAGVVALGMIPIFYWVFSSIGGGISPTQGVRERHELVTRGPYRWVRHPLYTSAIVFYLALSVLTAMWWISLGLLIGGAIIVWRTGREEANLIAEFGEEYLRYQQRTGRFLPRLVK